MNRKLNYKIVYLVSEWAELPKFILKKYKKIAYINNYLEMIHISESKCILIFGIGKTNSASCTSFILNCFKNIEIIINFGFCGASKYLNINDICVINEFKYFDVDITPMNYHINELPDYYIEKASENMINYAKKLFFDLSINYNSTLYTSDSFITMNKLKNVFMKDNEKACYDMEGAAISHVCKNYGFKNYLVIKLVSDICTENNNNRVYKNFIKNKNQILKEIWKKIIV